MFAFEGLADLFQPVFISGANREVVSGSREAMRSRQSDPAGGAGDDRCWLFAGHGGSLREVAGIVLDKGLTFTRIAAARESRYFQFMRSCAFVVVLILFFTSNAHATKWTSPDGKVSFDLPSDGSLVEVKNPAGPASGVWDSADGKARLVFLTQPNPQNTPLNRAGLEKGSLQGVPNSTHLSTNESYIGGVHVITIATVDNKPHYYQQSVMTFDGTFYKLMAGGPIQISSDPRFTGVFQSLNVAAATPNVSTQNDPPKDFSMKLADIGIYVLLIAGIAALIKLIAVVIRRALRTPPNPPPLS